MDHPVRVTGLEPRPLRVGRSPGSQPFLGGATLSTSETLKPWSVFL